MNERGNMLVAAMVGLAITGILFAAITTMLGNAQRETLSLSQKLEMLQLQGFLGGTLANADLCSCNLDSSKNTTQPANTLSFNSTNATTLTASRVNLTNLYGNCASGSPSDPLVTQNAVLPGTTSGLQVSAVFLENFQQVGVAGSGRYTANLTVNFDANRLVIARRPVTVPINIEADVSNPAQARIINCTSGDATAMQNEINRQLSSVGSCPPNEFLRGYNPDGTPICGVPAPSPAPAPAPAPAPPAAGTWSTVTPCSSGTARPGTPRGSCSPVGTVQSGNCMAGLPGSEYLTGYWMAQCR